MSSYPWHLTGILILLSIRSSRTSAVLASGAAMAKSSTWRLRRTRLLLIISEYKHGSWMVGVIPSLHRITLACFSHRRGDSGCPCIAERIGITWPPGIGGCFLWLTHHSWKALSGCTKNPYCGGGALATRGDSQRQRLHRKDKSWFDRHNSHTFYQGYEPYPRAWIRHNRGSSG